jgi:hypothetical protein
MLEIQLDAQFPDPKDQAFKQTRVEIASDLVESRSQKVQERFLPAHEA